MRSTPGSLFSLAMDLWIQTRQTGQTSEFNSTIVFRSIQLGLGSQRIDENRNANRSRAVNFLKKKPR